MSATFNSGDAAANASARYITQKQTVGRFPQGLVDCLADFRAAWGIATRIQMKNTSRTARTRELAIQAAIAVLTRDGPNRLTIDAIARESGISKGGVLHHFPSKQEILKALVEYQMAGFVVFCDEYIAQLPPNNQEVTMHTSIALCKHSEAEGESIFIALLAGLSENRNLLEQFSIAAQATVERMRAEAEDPDLSLLRWVAAIGINHLSIVGISPFTVADRERLFARLMDDEAWRSR